MPEMPKPSPKMVPAAKGVKCAWAFVGDQTAQAAKTREAPRAATGNCQDGDCNSAIAQGDAGSTLNTCRHKITVATAVPMNVGTAIQLRKLKRGRPQMPWPLVQPLPMRVPMPVQNPPSTYRSGEKAKAVGKAMVGFATRFASPPRTNPSKKSNLHT
mmetsp:Transcript_79804/g.140861  ORF Transcript_79804/g.140861 Transcript_79804/m.140861 type:complete len:157 (+) Transcript_79804:529-999(+)